MSRHWEAPRIAYELAAERAEQLAELEMAGGSGGSPGQPPGEAPRIGKAWDDLRTLERHDVLVALGAQARSAVYEARKFHQMSDGEPLVIEVSYYTRRMCEEAREALRALNDPSGPGPWKLPECSHCAGLVASALADVQVAGIRASGVDDPAYVLRALAAAVLALPDPREAADD